MSQATSVNGAARECNVSEVPGRSGRGDDWAREDVGANKTSKVAESTMAATELTELTEMERGENGIEGPFEGDVGDERCCPVRPQWG
jgi:hypothetical protein